MEKRFPYRLAVSSASLGRETRCHFRRVHPYLRYALPGTLLAAVS